MPTSIISICNMALAWIGTNRIAALTENSPGAQICSQFYDPARLQTLRDHQWNFAQSRATLAPVDVPAEYPEYAYAYAWPDKCVRAHKVYLNGNDYDFTVVLGPDGASRMILTSVPNAVLSFTADVSDPTLFDPLYARALARRLAADAGTVIFKNNPQKMQELETYYLNEVRKAQAKDAEEGTPDNDTEIPWITARTI